MATVIDVLMWANWQRGGKPNAPKPTPVPRPGVKDSSTSRVGDARYTTDEIDGLFASLETPEEG